MSLVDDRKRGVFTSYKEIVSLLSGMVFSFGMGTLIDHFQYKGEVETAFILCGITVITNPFSTTAVLWMFIGISLIVDAVFDMIGGVFGNREKAERTKEEA